MNIKLLLLLNFFFGVVTMSIAQSKTYQYTYDNAGNRITREIIYVSLKTTSSGDGTSQGAPPNYSSEMKRDTVTANLGAITINVYPNPTAGVVSIDYSEPDFTTKEVRIIDANGRVMYQKRAVQGNFALPFESLATGQYFVWLNINGKIKRFAVIKK